MKKLLIGLVAISSFSVFAGDILIDASCKASCSGTTSTLTITGTQRLQTVQAGTIYADLENKTRAALDKSIKSEMLKECKSSLNKTHSSVSMIKVVDVNCLYFKSR